MKKHSFTVFIVVLISMFFFVTNAVAGGWHTWPQYVRNQAIIDETHEYNNTYVGLNCKLWVRKVVKDASGGLVTIPSTSSNLYTWNPDSNVVGRSGLLQYAQPG